MQRSGDHENLIREGERVTIFLKGKKYTVTVREGRLNLGSLSIPGSEVIGKSFGTIPIAGMELIILPATAIDHMETMRRGPQVILPDDASTIIFFGSVTPGSTILEAGSGSGGLTTALASAVGESGRIISMDLKGSNSEMAKKNIRKAGFSKRVSFIVGDVKEPETVASAMNEGEIQHFDAIILDMPDPCEAMNTVQQFLRIGGTLVGYLPTMNQVEKLRGELEDWNEGKPRFIDILTREALIREIVVRKGAVRPEYSMLGHTAYLTFARKYR